MKRKPGRSMEKILDLSQSELQELLDHPEKVESMAQESDEIQNIQLEREMSLASNRSLAEENLNMRPHLESQREVLVGKYTQLKAVRETYKEHQSIIERIVGQVSPEALFSRLQTEGEKAEAESEVLADVFLEGSLPLDSFLERFLVLRSVAHKRRVLIEKFQEAMQHKTEAITPSAHIGSPDGAPNNLWNPQTETATAKHLHQGNTKCLNSSYVTASQPLSSPAGSVIRWLTFCPGREMRWLRVSIQTSRFSSNSVVFPCSKPRISFWPIHSKPLTEQYCIFI
ncbi:vacuolar protein sorting-associated protein 37C isoform X3 [Corythoichthys intestinalis]|uniref:vacuolar protein sorting-associated protein 37C isoform X3 n=1 Tax=Corythoichthys intestinalis TaxID=161448 RepID=UPI0025A615F2|nr:vacuolar protein sorting-associated protein 37C isoform X3 [Corythoichthys intestinalis]